MQDFCDKVIVMLLEQNILGHCPGGWCDYLVQFSEVLVVLLLADGFIFLVTLIPPLFSWKNKKPDSRKRIFFAAFACLTFYFWLAVLAIHSLYCFGFLAHAGPCNSSTSIGTSSSARASQLTSDPVLDSPIKNNLGPQENDSLDSRLLPPEHLVDGEGNLVPNMTNMSLAMAEAMSQDNTMEKCINNTENSLKNITLVNFLIILILIIVVAANVNEGEASSFSLNHCNFLLKNVFLAVTVEHAILKVNTRFLVSELWEKSLQPLLGQLNIYRATH